MHQNRYQIDLLIQHWILTVSESQWEILGCWGKYLCILVGSTWLLWTTDYQAKRRQNSTTKRRRRRSRRCRNCTRDPRRSCYCCSSTTWCWPSSPHCPTRSTIDCCSFSQNHQRSIASTFYLFFDRSWTSLEKSEFFRERKNPIVSSFYSTRDDYSRNHRRGLSANFKQH